jgi:SAM-dependent methyltransferase
MSIAYYDRHAAEYVAQTITWDMTPALEDFLQHLPANSHVLDIGCGSGRDTLAMLKHGYRVTALDGSSAMVNYSSRLTGQQTLHQRIEDITFQETFDGIWACASLLHIPVSQLPAVFQQILVSLRAGGFFWFSFKYGDGDRQDGDRHFTDFTSQGLREFLGLFAVRMVDLTINQDTQGRPVQWLQALVQKQ